MAFFEFVPNDRTFHSERGHHLGCFDFLITWRAGISRNVTVPFSDKWSSRPDAEPTIPALFLHMERFQLFCQLLRWSRFRLSSITMPRKLSGLSY